MLLFIKQSYYFANKMFKLFGFRNVEIRLLDFLIRHSPNPEDVFILCHIDIQKKNLYVSTGSDGN